MVSSRCYAALLPLAHNHLSSMGVCGMVHLRTHTLPLWKAFSPAERQTNTSQAFPIKFLIPQLSAVWSAVVPIFGCNTSNKHVYPTVDLTSFRHSTPVWVLSIVDLALEANELSVELARHTDNSNYLVFDGWKNVHENIPIEKTVEPVDVPTSGATITALYDPLPYVKNSHHHGGSPR
jgi:hypothetical protein